MATKKNVKKGSVDNFDAETRYAEYARNLYSTLYDVFMSDSAEDKKLLKIVNAKSKSDDVMEKYISAVGELLGTQKTLKADAFRNIYLTVLTPYYEWKRQRDLEEQQHDLEELEKTSLPDLELIKFAGSIIYDILKDAPVDPTELSFEELKARADKLAENNKTVHVAKKDPKTNKYSFTPKDSDYSGN